jgi:division protein CdvB (Snf7/Vps24/ESCRT-III family)
LPRENHTVIRTEKGLTVKGSRLTLYYIMDEMKENNSLKNVRDIYELTDEEMLDILDYIHLHHNEVEAEYSEVVKSSEQNRKYGEEKNREQMGKNYQQQETVRAKLREWREQYHT